MGWMGRPGSTVSGIPLPAVCRRGDCGGLGGRQRLLHQRSVYEQTGERPESSLRWSLAPPVRLPCWASLNSSCGVWGCLLSTRVSVAAASASGKGLSPLVATAEDMCSWLVTNEHGKGEKILENFQVAQTLGFLGATRLVVECGSDPAAEAAVGERKSCRGDPVWL